MMFEEIVDQAIDMVRRRGRVTYRMLKRQFDLDDASLEDLKDEILYSQSQIVDDEGRGFAWTGGTEPAASPPMSVLTPATDQKPSPVTRLLYTTISHRENPDLPQCSGRRAQAGHST